MINKKMTLRDKKGWAEIVATNTDSYSKGVLRFANRWACLIEKQIANGEVLEKCAEKTADMADTEGITGFMYGCAVHILSKVWVHGEQLRRWHNIKTQIGHEGEKANKNGKTLNPALLSIG